MNAINYSTLNLNHYFDSQWVLKMDPPITYNILRQMSQSWITQQRTWAHFKTASLCIEVLIDSTFTLCEHVIYTYIGDAEYLDINNVENNILITLKSEYNIEYFEGKNYLLSTIVATVIDVDDTIESKGVAFIIFDITQNATEIPSVIIPTFTNRYYIGNLKADLTQIDIESIDLIDDVVSDNVIFNIEESGKWYTYIYN